MNKKKKKEKKPTVVLSRFFHKHPITIRSVAFIDIVLNPIISPTSRQKQ